MTQSHERWQGVALSEDYTLEKWLSGDDVTAFFQASIAREGRQAIVMLVPEEGVNGRALFDLWQRTRELRHPNLIELLDFGRAEFPGEVVLYAVFEAHDDTLASALSGAALSPSEAREVLDSVLGALAYLHNQGLVIDALTPEDVVAVGDRIKLSTGALREAAGPADYANNVKMLGEFWQEALLPASPRSSEIVALATAADPQARWSLAQIGAALNERAPVAQVVVADPPVREHAAVAASTSPGPTPAPAQTGDHTSSRRFLTLLLASGVFVLVLVLWLNRSQPTVDVGIQTQGSAARVTTDTAPIVKKDVQPPRPREVAKPSPLPPAGKEMWRVIAFTYRSKEAAAKKAQELNRKVPGIEAAVFSPSDRVGYYLVSVGGRLTREEAVALQRSARGKGLPRDLYIQNYTR